MYHMPPHAQFFHSIFYYGSISRSVPFFLLLDVVWVWSLVAVVVLTTNLHGARVLACVVEQQVPFPLLSIAVNSPRGRTFAHSTTTGHPVYSFRLGGAVSCEL